MFKKLFNILKKKNKIYPENLYHIGKNKIYPI